jgi:ketosteroid isomerase-like protein
MEIARLAYPTDTSRWAHNIADDALFMQGTGVMLNKAQTIDAYKNGIPAENSTDLKETEFRQSGDIAIFSYTTARIRHDDAERSMRHQHVHRSVVYQKRNEKWQLVFLSAAIVPYADAKQRPVEPKILDEYAGVYADFPPPRTVTLSRDGAKLVAQGSWEKEKTEFISLSDDTFVLPGEPNQLYFERGPDGHVLHVWYRDVGGEQILQKRVTR